MPPRRARKRKNIESESDNENEAPIQNKPPTKKSKSAPKTTVEQEEEGEDDMEDDKEGSANKENDDFNGSPVTATRPKGKERAKGKGKAPMSPPKQKATSKSATTRRETALRTNPPGVKVICPSDAWTDNGPALAGYLELKDTLALRGLLDRPIAKRIVEPFLQGK